MGFESYCSQKSNPQQYHKVKHEWTISVEYSKKASNYVENLKYNNGEKHGNDK